MKMIEKMLVMNNLHVVTNKTVFSMTQPQTDHHFLCQLSKIILESSDKSQFPYIKLLLILSDVMGQILLKVHFSL